MLEHKVTVSSIVEVEHLQEMTQLIKDCVRQVLHQEEMPLPALVDVTIMDDASIRELNQEYRKVDKSTDVLSFPLCEFYNGKPLSPLEDEVDHDTGLVPLGDIMLSFEHARAQAEEYGHSVRRECGYLAIHSALHLLGYDHERSEEEKDIMRAREELALDRLNLGRDK